MTTIIGFGNKARQGKDECAKAIKERYSSMWCYRDVRFKVQHLAFADALYREVNDWLATDQGSLWLNHLGGEVQGYGLNIIWMPPWVMPSANAEKSDKAPYGKHPLLLQWWGTEYRRKQDPDYWVKRWKEAIDPDANLVLTTDMRFKNEAQAIKDLGGFTVNVTRRTVDGAPFVAHDRNGSHPSEMALDDFPFDFYLVNSDGHLRFLHEQAVTLVEYLRSLEG